MEIKRRNAEGVHPFVQEVARDCGIYDLQGLLLNADWKPTAAIEAYEFTGTLGELLLTGSGIPSEELYIKCVFAQQIGVPLYVLAHSQGRSNVTIYEFQADHSVKAPRCVSACKKTDQEFVAWWRSQKQTIQTKAYRPDMSCRIAASYFDQVLEACGEKWGGNIDGYLVSWDSGDAQIVGLVENRVTNRTDLHRYDPQDYFFSGGGDYYTWRPLIDLRNQLKIPLFLATYSNRSGERHLAGLTKVETVTSEGITYCLGPDTCPLRPCDNIMSSTADIGKWFQDHR